MNFKKSATTAFKILFAGGLISWLVATDRFQVSELKSFLQWPHLMIGFLIVGLHMIVITERWRQLLISQSFLISRFKAWRLSQVGLFFSFAVPGGVGGDVMKAFLLQKDHQATRATAYSSALMDRVLGLYSFVILALIGLLIEIQTTPLQSELLAKLLVWIALLFVILTTGFLVVTQLRLPDQLETQDSIKGKIYRFNRACRSYLLQPVVILKAILITFTAQLMTLFFFYWFFTSVMGEHVSWPLLFFAVPLGFMLMAVPLTPAGIGIGQAAFYFLFQTFSNGEIKSGSAVITAFQLMLFAWGLVGAVYFMIRKGPVPQSNLN